MLYEPFTIELSERLRALLDQVRERSVTSRFVPE
jgi:hypothetical protein